jgi:serine/threonine protein kinase
MSETKANSSFLNKLKDTVVINEGSNLPDITGKTLGEFHVDRRMHLSSGEADIYRCSGTGSHAGAGFVLKYYRRENAVKQEVLEKIRSIKSPCVAPVAGYGEYEGHQYAVRPYYEMPVLSEVLAYGNTISEEELKTLIIPSVIAGLKALHDVGILHRDLKPANLIPDNTCEHIVLIDFGISSDAGKNTFVVTHTGMTPFYAAPEAMQGIFHKETDYYALGITLFELFTGFTPFQNPGLSPEAAAILASISKIEFPENFPEDLKKLILGLTYKDISHRNESDNPNRRWGYDEIRRWLAGEDVPVPMEPFLPSATEVLPYTMDNRKLFTASDLVIALLKNPEHGIKELARGKLTQHYGYFDPEKEELCKRAEMELGSSENEHYLAFFRLMYRISPNESSLFCGGKEFSGLADLAFAAVDEAIAVAENGCGLDTEEVSPFLKEVTLMLRSGALKHYAEEVEKNAEAVTLFQDLEKFHKTAGRQYSPVQQALVFGYGFSNNRKLAVLGVPYSSPQDFADRMVSDSKKDRYAHEKQLLAAREELEFLISAMPDTASQDGIQLVYDDARSAIFGDFEFRFRDENDFNDFVEECIRKGNTYVVKSLLYRYGESLEAIASCRYWKGDTCDRLKKIVDTMIPMGEYLFADEKAFARFVHDMEEEGREKPLFLRDFAQVHEPYLQKLVDADNSSIAKLARSLLKHKNDVEKSDRIRIWGNRYPSLSSCSGGRGYGLDLIDDEGVG